MPKVSIILPVYNVEKYIRKSIDSILNQTYIDFELLVIIDGSPDNSKQIAKGVNDPRITIHEKENGGLSDARNYGLERASGEFIYFMDSDDWIEPNLLEENCAILEKEQLDFIVFGYIQDNENLNGDLVESSDVIPKVSSYKKGDETILIDTYHLGLLGYAWNKVYRKSFLDQHQFKFKKGISLVEDILFNAPLYTISTKIRFNPKAYYHYINRPVVTLMKAFHQNTFDLIGLKIESVEKFLNSWGYKEQDIKQVSADIYIQSLKYYIDLNVRNSNNQSDLKYMFNLKETVYYIDYYKPKGFKGNLYKFLIKHKLVKLVFLLKKL